MRWLLILSLFAVTTVNPSQKKQAETQPQSTNTQSLPNPTSPVTVVVNQPAPETHKDASKKQARDWYDILVLIAAFVAAFIGLRSLHQVKRQAEATEAAANAAKDNARAVINAERAWVMASIQRVPGQGTLGIQTTNGEGITTTGYPVRIVTKNDGKTPAWIVEKRAVFVIRKHSEPLPAEPDINSMKIIQDSLEPLTVGEETKLDKTLTSVGIQDYDHPAYIYGRIKYRDVFSDNRETFFGYEVAVNGHLERLSGYPKYNTNK
jgi:hypothetical protein